MATIRKTAKFYREELVKVQNVTTLNTLIKEIVLKFGKDNNLYIDGADCNWNHWVKGFCVNKKGEVFVNVYWQGDSTDGDTCVHFNEVYGKGKSVIKAETYWDGSRTRFRHGDISVEKYEVEKLIKLVAEWLSPSAIKERKQRAEISKVKAIIDNKMGNEYFSKYAYRCGDNEEYYNGRYAVNELFEKEKETFVKMDINRVLEIVDVVFRKNYKTKRFFGGDRFTSNTKPYDITY